MDNWIGVIGNKLKDILDKLTGHDSRFDALDALLARSEDSMEQLQEASGSAKIYAPSQTIRHTIGKTSTFSGSGTQKLFHFTAKYSGNIMLKIAYSCKTNNSTQPTLDYFNYFDQKYIDLANGVNADLLKGKGTACNSCKLHKDLTEANIIVPVKQGERYIFETSYLNITSLIISKIDICFDVISSDEVNEFA